MPQPPSPALPARKAAGVFFTPEPVVRAIVRETLQPLLPNRSPDSPLRILEPACGHGVFLKEAYRCLLDWHPAAHPPPAAAAAGCPGRPSTASDRGQPTLAHRGQILLSSLFAVDRDPQAVAITRRELARLAAGDQAALAADWEAALAAHIRCGDALIEPDFEPPPADDRPAIRPLAWHDEFREVFDPPPGGFDAIVGNPPYVNIRTLTRHYGSAVKRYLQARYRCAAGNYDLYVLFIEAAFRWLRPGGMCGLIVPNKLATLDYASRCRQLLAEQATIRRIIDLSGCRVFPEAGVYPYIVIWQKSPPGTDHQVTVERCQNLAELSAGEPAPAGPGAADAPAARTPARGAWSVPQPRLAAHAGWSLHGSLDVESRVATRPLSDWAEIHSGTTGFSASRMAERLIERPPGPPPDGFPFVVSGNLDRYAIRLGGVRFMKRRWADPWLPGDPWPWTRRKRRLYENPKILVAGMTRRLEAAWDPGGLALGVQVYAVVPKSDAFYLLALLNSKLLSHLFRLRFQAKRLAGGYLAINKGQLEQLPIATVDPHDDDARQRANRLAEYAAELSGAPAGNESSHHPENARQRRQELERQIDQSVCQLYRLTADEIALVEAETD